MVIFLKGNSSLLSVPATIITSEKPKSAVNIFRQFGFFVAGFLFSFSGRGYEFSPIGVALIASSPEKYLICVSSGAALGYILSQNSISALRYIAAVLCAFVLSKLMFSLEKRKNPALFAGAISAFCVFSTGIALALADLMHIQILVLFSVEALIAFSASYFIYSSFECSIKSRSFKNIPMSAFSSYAICLSLIFWSLSGFTFFGFGFFKAAALYALLIFAYIFKQSGTAIFGSVLSLVFCVLSKGQLNSFYYAFGGVLCGMVSQYGRLFTALVLFLINCAFFFVDGNSSPVFIAETALACIAFSLTPKKYIEKISSKLLTVESVNTENGLKRALASRIKIASSAINEVGNTVSLVSGSLQKLSNPPANDIYSLVTQQVCSSCGLYEKCWERNMVKTASYFDEISSVLRRNELMSVRNMPRGFQNSCIKLTSLAESFNKNYLNYTAKFSMQNKVNDMRLVVADQFSSVCDILSDLGDELKEPVFYDTDKQNKIRLILSSYNIIAYEIICKKELNSRMIVEIECEKIENKVTRTDLTARISSVCGRDFEKPEISQANGHLLLVFCEKYSLLVQTGSFQLTSKGESLCGDSFEYFYDGRGSFFVVLSDGMGTGSRAAIDGAMASNLASRLIRSGFSPDCSLRLINSALLIKSREESLSSLDILQIDMFSGKTKFFKAGAASSYIKKKNRLFEIKKPAFAVGYSSRG